MVAACAFVAAGCGEDGGGKDDSELTELDWAAWRAPDGTESTGEDGLTARQRISDALMECECLEGTDRATVIELMGKAERAYKTNTPSKPGVGLPSAGLSAEQRQTMKEVGEEVEEISEEVEEGSREVFHYTVGICTADRCLFPGDREYLDVYIDFEGRVKKIDGYGT